jgi:hypothetical protein
MLWLFSGGSLLHEAQSLDLCLLFLEVLKEFLVLGVTQAMINMKGHWKSIPGTLPFALVVLTDIPEESLLIAQVKVILNSIVNLSSE